MSAPLVLYLHVPKTGGTTLTNILSTVYHRPGVAGDRVYDGVYYYPAGFELQEWDAPEPDASTRDVLQRGDLRAVVGHFHYGLYRYTSRRFERVTMLRDPVDRMLSLYRHMQRHRGLTVDLEDFVQQPPLREADNGQTRRLSGELRSLGDRSQHMLDAALAHLDEIKVVGITERFDESVVLMSRRLQWDEIPSPYYPRNVETQRPRTRAISPTVCDLIRENSELDVALYEAARQRFECDLAAEPEEFWDILTALRRAKEDFFRSLSPEANEFVIAVEDRRLQVRKLDED